MNLRWTLFVYVAVAFLFATWALLPISWVSYRPSDPVGIYHFNSLTLLSPLSQLLLLGLSCISAIVLLILGLLTVKWPVIRYPSVAVLLAIMAFPFAGVVHVISNLGPWTIHGQVETSAGERYAFFDTSFLQGQIMALGRIESENLLYTQATVLGANNGDSPRSWASVIRPANPNDEYGQLYLTESNMLVGIRYDNKCFLAYDLNKKLFYGHGDVEALSPFVCLGSKDELHANDIAAIEKIIMESKTGRFGFPHIESVKSGLTHSNLKVQDVARELTLKLDESQESLVE